MTATQDQAALKPCPFCGGSATSTYKTDDHTGLRKYSIFCIALCGGNTGEKWSQADAVAAWNTRAQPQQPSGWRDIASSMQQPADIVAWRYWNEKSQSWNTTDSEIVASVMREHGRAVELLCVAHPAEQQEGVAIAWKTSHPSVCVPFTDDPEVANEWYRAGYPVQELFGKQQEGGDARDAARYRFIRDVPHCDLVRSVLTCQQNAIMDDVVDAAMQAMKGEGSHG